MVKSVHRRAYINPLPGYSEAAQHADILKSGPINEWYIESRNVTRQDFIDHLRPDDHAVVARIGCLAKTGGRMESRLNDLIDARSDIHGKRCAVFDAVLGTDSAHDWPNMKNDARDFMLAQRSIKNGSARKLKFTNAEIKTMLRIRDSRRYQNDNQRRIALEKEGIKPVPGRTWLFTKLPMEARERGIEI